MKSVKPGRGPSFMGGVGAIAAAVFGVIWIVAASSMGAPSFFPLFGMVFVGIGIGQAIYHFKNAAGKNRYSTFDITDANEEPDPLNQYFGEKNKQSPDNPFIGLAPNGNFCPYCGCRAETDFQFCKQCGKKLP